MVSLAGIGRAGSATCGSCWPRYSRAGVGTAASAQEQPVQDRFTMEEVRNGWIVAPDFKFTQINDGDAVLAGAYGGKMIDGRFLVGGGAYWLSGAPDVNMAYGGGLVEWFGNPGSLVDFS